MTKASLGKGLKIVCSWENVLSYLKCISFLTIIVYRQQDRAILCSAYMMIHYHHLPVWASTCQYSSAAASFSFACKAPFLHWCVLTTGGE